MGPKHRVTYFYDKEFAQYYFGSNHPMKPHRLAMTHDLVMGYGLHKHMDVFRARKAFPGELHVFHSQEYVEFLSRISPNNKARYAAQMREHNFDEDCPVFDGMFDFCRLYAGASLQAAQQLNFGTADIAINWSGGLHHAKKSQASGFCYVNDLVLAILELLKYHARVLYVDIDIHHGDGVEEAFYLTDRVMTVSFHKHGDYFFPGTGDLSDVGESNGRYYSINVPLNNGTDDKTFLNLFKPIMAKTIETFRPEAIVMQCGADSLANDRLGCFNLSTKGHGDAVQYLKSFAIPMLVTGGGGYTKHNVARCWTYETALLTGQQLDNELPDSIYHEYFAPDYCLNVASVRQMEDSNKKADLEKIKVQVLENLRHLDHAPGVHISVAPPSLPEYEVEGCNEDVGGGRMDRMCKYLKEHRIIDDNELYDGDHDNYGD